MLRCHRTSISNRGCFMEQVVIERRDCEKICSTTTPWPTNSRGSSIIMIRLEIWNISASLVENWSENDHKYMVLELDICLCVCVTVALLFISFEILGKIEIIGQIKKIKKSWRFLILHHLTSSWCSTKRNLTYWTYEQRVQVFSSTCIESITFSLCLTVFHL